MIKMQPIATARLLQNNSVGRVAVLEAYRGQGIGTYDYVRDYSASTSTR